jgi:TetR/AcrR family transcriptional repressor of nem operon
MKVDRGTMAAHREQIIVAAAARFRQLGFDGISVADLMREAGLTHGGFYGHFASKEELMALAAERAMADSLAKWKKVIEQAPTEPLRALAKSYLSERHHDHPDKGCLFAALGSELSRQPKSVKEIVTQGEKRAFDMLVEIVPGKTKAERKRKAIAAFARMIGGMVLARCVSDLQLRQEIFDSCVEEIDSA